MLNTVASLVTGVMIATAPIVNEPSTTEAMNSPKIEILDSYTQMSYPVSVNTSMEELASIQSAAEEAGMGFNYKKRGVKTRLVIDMVIETEDDYELERVVVKEEDGTKYLTWTLDETGTAVSFERPDAVKKEF